MTVTVLSVAGMPAPDLTTIMAAARQFAVVAEAKAAQASDALDQVTAYAEDAEAAAGQANEKASEAATSASAAQQTRVGIDDALDDALAAKLAAEAARDFALAARAKAETAATNTAAFAVIANDAAVNCGTFAVASLSAKNLAEDAADRAEASAASIDTSTFLDLAGTRQMTGPLTLDTPDANGASVVLPSGADPTSPVTGALWRIGTAVKVRLNGLLTALVAFTNVAQSWSEVQTFGAAKGIVLANGTDPASPAIGQAWYNAGFFGYVQGVKQRILDFSLKATTALGRAGTDDATFVTPAIAADAIAFRGALPAVSAKLATTAATTSNTYVDTGLSITITPRQASNKLEIRAGLVLTGANTGANVVRILRSDGITVFEVPYAGSTPLTFAPDVVDSPATTSAISYKVQIAGVSSVTISLLAGSTLAAMDIG